MRLCESSLCELLLRNRDAGRAPRFARAPEGYEQAGEWCVHLHFMRGEEWPWLRDVDGLQTVCAGHVRAALEESGFRSLRPGSPLRKKAKTVYEDHWLWKRGFCPDYLADTPPRLVVHNTHREVHKRLDLEKKRNATLRRCLGSSQEKLRKALESLDEARRELRDTKQDLAGAKRLLQAAHLGEAPLSAVQVDQMLNI